MIFENICTKKTYEKKDGTTKTTWLIVGTFKTTDDGKRFIELNLFPGLALYVFEKREKEGAAPSGNEEAPF